MSIFRPLDKLLKPPPMQRYGLSATEANELKLMRSSPGWNAYLKLLSNYAELQGQAMLYCSDDAAVHCARGLIQGLQSGPMLVDSIIESEKNRNEREREREQRAESATGTEDSRIDALYGTSLWPDRGAI